jgi:hypothetical protein
MNNDPCEQKRLARVELRSSVIEFFRVLWLGRDKTSPTFRITKYRQGHPVPFSIDLPPWGVDLLAVAIERWREEQRAHPASPPKSRHAHDEAPREPGVPRGRVAP